MWLPRLGNENQVPNQRGLNGSTYLKLQASAQNTTVLYEAEQMLCQQHFFAAGKLGTACSGPLQALLNFEAPAPLDGQQDFAEAFALDSCIMCMQDYEAPKQLMHAALRSFNHCSSFQRCRNPCPAHEHMLQIMLIISAIHLIRAYHAYAMLQYLEHVLSCQNLSIGAGLQ